MVDSELITSIHALKVSEIANKVARAKGRMMKLFYGEHEAKGWIEVDRDLGVELTVNLADWELVSDEGVELAPIGGTIMLLAAAERYEGPPIRFIMDTGCGHDLISKEKAKTMGLNIKEGPDSVNFITANGVAAANEVAEINVSELYPCRPKLMFWTALHQPLQLGDDAWSRDIRSYGQQVISKCPSWATTTRTRSHQCVTTFPMWKSTTTMEDVFRGKMNLLGSYIGS